MADPIFINERTQVRTAAARFRYWLNGRDPSNRGFPEDSLTKLDSLDVNTATAADVHAIFGRAIWVCETHLCLGCHSWVPEVVEVGDEDSESSTTLCKPCVLKALMAFPTETDNG